MGGAGKAHLVGSVPLDSAEEVFRSLAAGLGATAQRLPDGEANGWTNRSTGRFADTVGLERSGQTLDLAGQAAGAPRWRVTPGFDAANIIWPPTGHLEAATSSYPIFRRLRDEGVIAPGARFQVSLPSPFAVVGIYFDAPDAAAILPHFERHMHGEVREILRQIPHEDLAIQWDVAVELVMVLERYSPEFADQFSAERVVQLLADAGNLIPADTPMGYHFCYGNPGGKHIIEPRDTGTMVNLANVLIPRLTRPLNWLHMPVPISRDDDPYFAPLAQLNLPEETELYLGLVHPSDGLEGGRRRAAAARKVVRDFGVGTECGFRYVPPETVPVLLALHRELAEVTLEPGEC